MTRVCSFRRVEKHSKILEDWEINNLLHNHSSFIFGLKNYVLKFFRALKFTLKNVHRRCCLVRFNLMNDITIELTTFALSPFVLIEKNRKWVEVKINNFQELKSKFISRKVEKFGINFP